MVPVVIANDPASAGAGYDAGYADNTTASGGAGDPDVTEGGSSARVERPAGADTHGDKAVKVGGIKRGDLTTHKSDGSSAIGGVRDGGERSDMRRGPSRP